ncbi:MAG TPA: hypothetical protein VMM36_19200 [Opitutaceae bacterium]|nr:hypothetical protein [Opitutaceae bacterium]
MRNYGSLVRKRGIEPCAQVAKPLRTGNAAVKRNRVPDAVVDGGASERDQARECLRGNFVESLSSEVEPPVVLYQFGNL